MQLSYSVAKAAWGWTVSEDGVVVASRPNRGDAIALGRLLTVAARAGGGMAELQIQQPDGGFRPENIDRPSAF